MAVQRKKSVAEMGAQVERIINLGYRDGNVYQQNPRVQKVLRTFSRYAQNIHEARGGKGVDINRKYARSTYMGLSKG